MSRTIDERIVEMRFDNRQFERNVQTSLSTLDKLRHLKTWATLLRSAICPPLAAPSRRFGRNSRRLKSLP